jgi:hypothetical protein
MYFLQIFHCDAFGGWSKLFAFGVLVSSVQFNIINAPFYITSRHWRGARRARGMLIESSSIELAYGV